MIIKIKGTKHLVVNKGKGYGYLRNIRNVAQK